MFSIFTASALRSFWAYFKRTFCPIVNRSDYNTHYNTGYDIVHYLCIQYSPTASLTIPYTKCCHRYLSTSSHSILLTISFSIVRSYRIQHCLRFCTHLRQQFLHPISAYSRQPYLTDFGLMLVLTHAGRSSWFCCYSMAQTRWQTGTTLHTCCSRTRVYTHGQQFLTV